MTDNSHRHIFISSSENSSVMKAKYGKKENSPAGNFKCEDFQVSDNGAVLYGETRDELLGFIPADNLIAIEPDDEQ